LRRRLRLVSVGLGVLIAALIAGSLLIARELHDSAQRTYLDRVIPLRGATRDLLLQLDRTAPALAALPLAAPHSRCGATSPSTTRTAIVSPRTSRRACA
jgi:hypothetical protein